MKMLPPAQQQIIQVSTANQLLQHYQVGRSFFFASPHQTMLAQGTLAVLPVSQITTVWDNLPQRIEALLQKSKRFAHDNPIVVGAIPFDDSLPVQIVVPQTVQRGGALERHIINPKTSTVTSQYKKRPFPEPTQYIQGVTHALSQLKTEQLDKIVLARSLQLTAPSPINLSQLLENLAYSNPHGYTFAVDLTTRRANLWPLEAHAPQRTLIGASPELLVSRSGQQVIANPLAGSAARSADPIEDKRRADELLASAKDNYEHALVVSAVAAALQPYCRILHVPATPTLIHTKTMWHLSTQLVGELADPTITSLQLAVALHPTPAVCGFPTDRARALIKEIEPFERGFYTGMVGWCDLAGDGEWAVTIRCAEVENKTLRLFAGAGIVLGSHPEQELAETEAKFQTMLNAMGLRSFS